MAQAECTPGKFTSGAIDYRRWCGPASATLTIGSDEHLFKGGKCWRAARGFWSLDIGTQSLERKKAVGYSSFEVAVDSGAQKDGPHRGSVDYQFPDGKVDVELPVTVTLAGKQTRGAFSGSNVSGSFSCG